MKAPYTDPSLDVPPGVDFLDPAQVETWVAASEVDKPWRMPMRDLFVRLIQDLPAGAHVLEVGSGPGLLAQAILASCPTLASYTLLDFSPAMLAASRQRLARFESARFVQANFKTSSWTAHLRTDHAAVVSMQAVHEIRHKRHVPSLYAQVARLLAPCGQLLVCDGIPKDASLGQTSLYSTADEHLAAMQSAGFVQTKLERAMPPVAFVSGRLPR